MNIHRFLILAAAVTVASAVLSSAGERDGPEAPSVRPVPGAVSNALAQALPQWQITDTDRDDGVYRIALRSDEGTAVVRVDEEGQIRSIYQELRHAKAPEKVRRAVEKAFPGADVKETRKWTRVEVTYTVEVQRRGRRHEVKVNSDGRILEVERK